MDVCNCDVCTLLRWLNDHMEGAADRAIPALTEALWRVLADAESDTQGQIHQSLHDLGIEPHTLMMLRTAVKLASWELSAAAEENIDEEAEGPSPPVLH